MQLAGERTRGISGGRGDPALLLLHGLGATADVWQPLQAHLDTTWPGRWAAPDLPGHGGAPRLERYSFGALAAAAAAEVVEPGERVVVLGHSLGGVVGLALASGWFGVDVIGVIGLGIKVAWTHDELAKARALAARPATWFDTKDQAVQRHLLVSGLAGLVSPDDPAVDRALATEGERWRLALDARVFGMRAPDLPGLLAAARCPVVLARGERDPMVTPAQLGGLVRDARSISGAGHNAHVEDPPGVADLLAGCRAAWTGS